MIGVTAEQFPRGGALLISLMGGTGMLSVAVALPIMGRGSTVRSRGRACRWWPCVGIILDRHLWRPVHVLQGARRLSRDPARDGSSDPRRRDVARAVVRLGRRPSVIRRSIGAAMALCAAVVWTSAPRAQGQAQRKANWLTDGARPAADVVAAQRDVHHTGQRQEHEAGRGRCSSTTSRGSCTTCFRRSSSATCRRRPEPREIGVVAGVSDNIYGIDLENGTQIWKRHFDSTFEEPAAAAARTRSARAG